ncbi:GDSL-type esterase/lipase family protein [Niabella sp. CC-SYL272]|uniref:GDSL-type esterase/lipase family protein n=1 Tax=Niabella agricola TaxID=2891571 RepID=UPI001F3AE157|nr:GDSL-type esterase/lipase family protein [Niabella agricola]MCF3110561.1 GDSL-type esterase/lipase family protein [Niabella agricola]
MKLKLKKSIQAGLVVACILSGVGSQAQTPAWDSTYRPGSYALKVDQFKAFPNSSKDIVFLGNSITAGVDWTELLQNPLARNRGISGDITFGVLERLHEVTEGKPQKVFILIGTNDISRNVPDAVILDNYKRIIRQIKQESPATKIYFQTVLPVNSDVPPKKNHYGKDEHIAAVNEGLKKLGREEGITVIDLHPHFLKDGKLDKTLTYDGLHLNINGYRLWAKILKDGKYL